MHTRRRSLLKRMRRVSFKPTDLEHFMINYSRSRCQGLPYSAIGRIVADCLQLQISFSTSVLRQRHYVYSGLA